MIAAACEYRQHGALVRAHARPAHHPLVRPTLAPLHETQEAPGPTGPVAEIGVHHGKFLIPLVGNALRAEPAVAIDLFEDQSANVDTSGACVCRVSW